jgi:hypothetical protein
MKRPRPVRRHARITALVFIVSMITAVGRSAADTPPPDRLNAEPTMPLGFSNALAILVAYADPARLEWGYGVGRSRCQSRRASTGSAAMPASTAAASESRSEPASNCSISQQSCEPPA